MATRYENEIDTLQAQRTAMADRITALQALQAEIDALKATNSVGVQELAIGLHEILCTLVHDNSSAGCSWNGTETPNDAATVDWLHDAHALWLTRARLAIGKARDLGFTVTEPS